MREKWSKEKLVRTLLITSIIVLSIIGLYVLNLLFNNTLTRIGAALGTVLLPFVIAFFLSFITGPLAEKMHKSLKMKMSIAAILAIFIGMIFILGVMTIALVFILSQIYNILSSLINLIDYQAFETILAELQLFIEAYLENSNIGSILDEIANNGASLEKVLGLVGTIFVSLSSILSNIIGLIFVLVLTPVFNYYLITEKTYIFTSIAHVFPKDLEPHVVELGKRSDTVIKNYFKGQGIMMISIALYNGLLLGILSFFIPEFNIAHAVMFAILMGLMNIIPYLGAWIGIAAPIVFLLTNHLEYQQNGGTSSIFLIGIVAVLLIHLLEQALESSVLQPLVYGKSVHIHPLIVLSSILFFGSIFGFAGVLLAVPLAGTLKASYDYFKKSPEPVKKEPKKRQPKKMNENEST